MEETTGEVENLAKQTGVKLLHYDTVEVKSIYLILLIILLSLFCKFLCHISVTIRYWTGYNNPILAPLQTFRKIVWSSTILENLLPNYMMSKWRVVLSDYKCPGKNYFVVYCLWCLFLSWFPEWCISSQTHIPNKDTKLVLVTLVWIGWNSYHKSCESQRGTWASLREVCDIPCFQDGFRHNYFVEISERKKICWATKMQSITLHTFSDWFT